jgi:vancomycin permeability regulator SanA
VANPRHVPDRAGGSARRQAGKRRAETRVRHLARLGARWARVAGALALFAAWVALPVRLAMIAGAAPRIATEARAVRPSRVAIVFGAAVRGETVSAILYDRVAAAAELYRAGTVQKLLLSGDNRTTDYNEPGAMRRTALTLGVADADITLDYAGRSTYDTCYRAHAIFGLSEAVLVTQRFHLSRAITLCDALGVRATGFASDRRTYLGQWGNDLREVLASANAVFELFVTRPVPVLGPPEPIR